MRAPKTLGQAIDMVYESGHGMPLAEESQHYLYRHDCRSLGILTVYDKRIAKRTAKRLRPRTYGKVVVEVGAGVGLLALEIAKEAKHVYAIEVDPAWSWAFTQYLYREKPANLTWIFGMAEDVAEWLRADVAVMVTRSGRQAMRAVAERMAPLVVELDGAD